MFINIINGSLDGINANRCYSLRTTYLIFETFQILFPTASLIFTAEKVFIKWYIEEKEWSIKLRVDNGGWHETLNLFHVSRCEMLHFVTSYMKQNKSRKQTLESAQYGLEISFKLCVVFLSFHFRVSSESLILWTGSSNFFQKRGRVLKISVAKQKTTDQNTRLYLFNVFECLETQLMQQVTRVFWNGLSMAPDLLFSSLIEL